MKSWQVQQAKAQLSDVIRKARSEGPQEITVRGEPAVVVVSKEDYQRLIRPRQSFVELMRSSPLVGVDLDLQRDKSLARDEDII